MLVVISWLKIKQSMQVIDDVTSTWQAIATRLIVLKKTIVFTSRLSWRRRLFNLSEFNKNVNIENKD